MEGWQIASGPNSVQCNLTSADQQFIMRTSSAFCTALAAIAFTYPGALSQVAAVPDLAELQAKYDEKVKLDVLRPHEVAVADLNSKFATALERAQESAQKSGNLEEALSIKIEKESVNAGNYLPATDDDKTASSIRSLRKTYMTALSKLELERDKKHAPLKAAFVKSLEELAVSFTKAGNLDEALKVKYLKETIGPPLIVKSNAPVEAGQTVAQKMATNGNAFESRLRSTSWKYDPKDGKGPRLLSFDGTDSLIYVTYEMEKGLKYPFKYKMDETRQRVSFTVLSGEVFEIEFSSDFTKATLYRSRTKPALKLEKL